MMKKFTLRITSLMLLLLGMWSMASYAQTTVTIGTGTTSSYYAPIYISTTSSSYAYSNTISLFTPTEIGIAGNLISLAWEKANAVGYTGGDAQFDIYIKETTASSVPTTSGTFAAEVAGATLVYSSTTQSLPAAPGWVTFNLAAPFAYSGSSNLMVLVDWYRPSSATANYPEWYYTNTAGMAATWSGTSVNPTYSYGSGYTRPNIQMTFAPSAADDAGIAAIAAPVSPVAPGVNNVDVHVRNYGTANLTSATIGWAINGIAQTPFSWTGNLASATVDSNVTIGTYNFPLGQHEITAWTTLPNGNTDSATFNDTASSTVVCAVSLNGVYTIGGVSPDYTTIGAALADLDAAGVAGPVTFNIAAGTYNEQMTINEILGSSAVNNVTFQSATGNAADVNIMYNASSSDNWTLKLNGADYVTLQNLTFTADDSTYARVVVLENGAEYNTIDNCVIMSQPEARGGSNAAGIYASGSGHNYNTITNNEIWNGYYGTYFYGSSGSLNEGTIFEYNTVKDFYYYGVYFGYHNACKVNGNIVENHSSSNYVYGLDLRYCDNEIEVTKNEVNASGNTYQYTFRIYYCDATDSTMGLVANNEISVTGTSTSTTYGLYVYYSNYQKCYNNSVNVTAGSTSGRAAYYYQGSNNYSMNNIFSNTAGGYAMYVSGTPLFLTDYNNFYTNGTNLAYWTSNQTDLLGLQTASGQDANSVSLNPVYTADDLLFPGSIGMDNLGTPLVEVTDDILGVSRSATTPDMGCYEYTPPQDDAGIVSIDQPSTVLGPGSAAVAATFKNYGLVAINTVNLNFSVDGGPVTSYLWVGNLAPGATDGPTVIGNHTFTYGTHEVKVWTSDPNLNADGNTLNDTMTLMVTVCDILSGTFTIGDTNSGADYGSINAAINAMTSCGIGGNVTFNINAGTYNEQVTVPEIPGASLTNRVTFQSTTGNASDVVIQYAPTGTSDNWVWMFDGADYISVQNVTMKVDTPYSSYARVVVFNNEANYNFVTGSTLIGQDVTTSSTNYAVVYNENSLDEFNIISGNNIMYGSYGIRMYTPGTTTQELGNIIENNIISDFYYYGIYAYAQEGAIISGNTISNSASSSTVYGLYTYYCDGPIQVTKNRINSSGSGTNYPLRSYYCDAVAGSEGLYANNFIAQTGTSTGTVYAMYIYGSTNQKFYHNSVNVESTSSSAYGMYISSTSTSNIELVNNIFSMPGGGRPIYLGSSSYLTAISWMDYNVVYTTGSEVAYASASYATLADWTAFSGTDTNSVEADPSYATSSMLYPASAAINDIAIPLALVPTDIDDNPRSMTSPDPGAAEFDPPSNDMAILSWDAPTASACGLSSTEYITLSLFNNGLSPQTGTQVSYSIDGGTTWTTPELIAQVIPAGDTLVYTFNTPADMSTLGDYHCMAYVDAPGDVNVLNDSVSGITVTHIGTIASFPFMEDFSSGSTAYFGLNAQPEATIEVNNNQGNATPALFFTGGSSTGFTGGSTSATPTNAWIDNVTHHATAMTCNVDGTGLTGLKLAFDLKMENSYGWGYGWFRVLVNDTIQLTDLNGTMDFHATTPTSDPFSTVEFDLTPYLGQPFTITLQSSLKYAYGTGSNNGDNAYVDNFQLYEPSPHDVGINSVVYPVDSICPAAMTDVVVEIRNYGGVVQDSVPVTVQVMNPDSTFQTISGVYTDSLQPNLTDIFNVGSMSSTMAGTYYITAWTELPLDANMLNDTSTGTFNTISGAPISTFPYTENMETFTTGAPGTFANGWINDPSTGYRFQVNSGGTGSSNTGPDVDHTLGTSAGIYVYTEASTGSQGDEAYLISPCLNLNSLAAPELRFWYHMTGADINKLAVDVLVGGVWTEIFALVGPQQAAIASPWEEATVPLGMYQAADKLRFRVIRGASYEGDVSIDDILIQEAPQFEAELVEAYGLDAGCDLTTDDLMIKIFNKGGQTINGNLTASYMINGAAAAVTETVTDSIPVLDTLTYTFTTPINLMVGSDSLFEITAWIDLLNDPDPSNDTAMTSVNSLVSPMDPSVTNVSVTTGSQATMTVNNPDPNQVYYWYDSLNAMNEVAFGDTFVTPPLTNTTVYWVEAQWGSAANYLALGPGTENNNYVPCYGYYDYSWTKTLYTAAELNFFGQIDTLSYFESLSPSPNPYVMPTQKIWMGHSSDIEFQDNMYMDTTNMTKVFEGTISFSGPGEIKIPLDQSFVYNGSDNLVIYYENWDGDYQSGEPEFVASSISLNQCVYKYQDNSFPYVGGTSISNKPDIALSGALILGGNGCPSNRVPDTAFVTAPTVIADAGLDTNICLGDSAQLMVSASGGVPPYMYAWSPAGSLSDPNIADPMAGPMTTTTYSVTVTDQNGDSGTDDVIVLVNPGPNVNLTLPQDTIYDNAPALVLTGGTPAGGAYSGVGVSNGQFDPGAVTPVQWYTITYTYTDPVTGCTGSATDDIFVDEWVGITEKDAAQLSVFPNPTSGMVTVTMSSQEDVIDLSLLDVTGKVVFEQRVTDAQGQMTRELDLTNLPQGVYYVRLQAGDETKAVKVVKH